MQDSPWYLNALEYSVNTAYTCLPSRRPSIEKLQSCKIIGHRGAHLGTAFIENTLPGFEALVVAGVWGAEMDIRWTKDLVPVISHDPDCQRLFQVALKIADTPFSTLRRQVPQIPTLEEIVNAFAGRLHLMLEIKADVFPQPSRQAAILEQLLQPLTPVRDYHLLALDRALFANTTFAPLQSQVLVSILNSSRMSKQALEVNYGGIAGAYPFFTASLRQRHKQIGQRIGVGHIDSKRLLYQQIANGTDWIFSNRAIELQNIIRSECEAEKRI